MVAEAGGPKAADDPDAPAFEMLAHVSPVQWENVTLYEAYDVRPDLVRSRYSLR